MYLTGLAILAFFAFGALAEGRRAKAGKEVADPESNATREKPRKGWLEAAIAFLVMVVAAVIGEAYSSLVFVTLIMVAVAILIYGGLKRIARPRAGHLAAVAAMQGTIMLVIGYAGLTRGSPMLWVSVVAVAVDLVWLVVAPGTGSIIYTAVYLLVAILSSLFNLVGGLVKSPYGLVGMAWYCVTAGLLVIAIRERKHVTSPSESLSDGS
jgi:hypothetical protein